MTVGAPTIGMFTMVSPTSQHGQQSRVSFKIGCEERRFLSQLDKDQKSKMSGLAPDSLYHRGSDRTPNPRL
jgi:hypothetical protein